MRPTRQRLLHRRAAGSPQRRDSLPSAVAVRPRDSAHSDRRTRGARGRAARARRACARRPGPPPSCARARRPCRGRARPPSSSRRWAGSSGGSGCVGEPRGVGAEQEVEDVARVADDGRAGVEQLVRARGGARGHRAGDGGDGAAEVGGEVGGDERAGARGGLDDDRQRRERGDDAVAGGEAPAVAAEAGRHLGDDGAGRDQPGVEVAHARGVRGLGAAGEHGDGRRARCASSAPRWAAESMPSAMPETTGTPAAVSARPSALETSRP